MAPVRGDGMRGLAVFISDIRNCKYKLRMSNVNFAHLQNCRKRNRSEQETTKTTKFIVFGLGGRNLYETENECATIE